MTCKFSMVKKQKETITVLCGQDQNRRSRVHYFWLLDFCLGLGHIPSAYGASGAVTQDFWTSPLILHS